MRAQAWSMLPVPSALRIMASSRVGNAGAPDLVPVFSWLFLRGRCRHCGAHIPARYLLVELLGGVLALGCTWRYGAAYALPGGLFGMSWAALLALAVCGILLSVSLIDAETQTIPDRLNLALAVCGAVSVLLSPADWLPHVIGALCVSVPMFLLCLVIDGACWRWPLPTCPGWALR